MNQHQYCTTRISAIDNEIARLELERSILWEHAQRHQPRSTANPLSNDAQFSVWFIPVNEDRLLITSTKFDFDTMMSRKSVTRSGTPVGAIMTGEGAARQLASFLHNRYRDVRDDASTYPVACLDDIVDLLWFMEGKMGATAFIDLAGDDHGKRADPVRGGSWSESYGIMCDQWDAQNAIIATPIRPKGMSELSSLFDKLKRI
ncbi:hypothetical protein [Sphingomonas sp. NFX23]|uniref:hypothetical protein n=1 Tax=Sphingomonas sp. NFX23 TaxID=2819532 RepID=UPI003CF02215